MRNLRERERDISGTLLRKRKNLINQNAPNDLTICMANLKDLKERKNDNIKLK